MNEQQVTGGHQDGATDSQGLSARAKKRAYKEAIRTLPKPRGALEPTLPERINRLNPSERHTLRLIVRSLKLRKIIRRTLAEAFWAREAERARAGVSASMQRLRAAARSHESSTRYERALTASVDALTFDVETTRSQQPTILEISQ